MADLDPAATPAHRKRKMREIKGHQGKEKKRWERNEAVCLLGTLIAVAQVNVEPVKVVAVALQFEQTKTRPTDRANERPRGAPSSQLAAAKRQFPTTETLPAASGGWNRGRACLPVSLICRVATAATEEQQQSEGRPKSALHRIRDAEHSSSGSK